MWSFPACPGSGMKRVRFDVIRFFILPYRGATTSLGCAARMRGALRTAAREPLAFAPDACHRKT